MKYKIEATTFNKIKINPEIEFFVSLSQGKQLLPNGIYEELQNRVFEEFNEENLNFYIISKDIEGLLKINTTINFRSFKDIIYSELSSIIKNSKINSLNANLQRVVALLDEKKLTQATTLFQTIDKSSLSKYNQDEYEIIEFRILALEKKNIDIEQFYKLKNKFENNPIKAIEIYFIYIKYLEDIRDESKPNKLIEEFDLKYPYNLLTSNNKQVYHYLKGRSNYLRGEFLVALKELSKSKEFINDNDKLLSDVYNTTANSFSDNLFFDEALEIAQKSRDLRNKLHLPQEKESVSLLAGIYFKSGNFTKALEYYEKALSMYLEENIQPEARIYNYCAKASLMLNNFDKALKYLNLSKDLKDDKKGFNTLYFYLYYFKTKDFKSLKEYFEETLVENISSKNFDKFVLGWCYAILSQWKFKEQEYSKGVDFLYKSVDYFIKDKYILEAFYVSLFVYKYDIGEENIDAFLDLIDNFELNKEFEEYVEKHINISKDYSTIFESKISEKHILSSFFEETYNITPYSFNTEEVDEILNRFCLL